MGMIALEKRVLLDAAGMVTAAEGGAGPDPDHAKPDPRDAAAERAVAETIDALGAVGPGRDEQSARDGQDPAATGTAGEDGRTILVVDARVRAADSLLQGLPDGVEVLRIEAGEDGIAKLGQALSADRPTAAIHILAHGEEGSFTLGNRLVDADTATNQLAEAFRAWSEGLTADADILLYGCDTGAGAAGGRLVATLANLTGADIAASDDDTGAGALGGDWELEVTAGAVTSLSPLAAAARDAWQDKLTAPTVEVLYSYPVSEPSSLGGGSSTTTLVGISIVDDDYSGADDVNGDPIVNDTVTVSMTVGDPTKGSLADPGAGGTAIADGFSFTGSRTAASAWLSQLQFTAADVEVGDSGLAVALAINVTDAEGLQGTGTAYALIRPSSDPAEVPDGAMTVVEGAASTTVTNAALALNDPEVTVGAQDNSQMIYRLTTAPSHGNLLKNGDLLGVGSIFTHDDVVNNRITYQHTASGADQNTADAFGVSVNDGATPQANSDTATVTITITPVNQAPSVGGAATVYEGQPANAQNSNTGNGGASGYAPIGSSITTGTGDDPGDSVTIRITSLTGRGTLAYNGTAVIDGVSTSIDRALTAADLTGAGFVIAAADKAGLTYLHDGSNPDGAAASDSFGLSVTDAGGGLGAGGAKTATGTFTITISPVNDDPVWDAGSSLTATVTAAGPDGNAGATADNYRVVLTQAMMNATDTDSSSSNLSFAIVQGGLQYGQILKNGDVLAAGQSFTLADVIAGSIVYVQTVDPDPQNTDILKFVVFDNAQSLRWAADGEDFARQGGIYDGPDATDPLTQFTLTINLADGIGTVGGGAGNPPAPPQADPNQILFIGQNPTDATDAGTISEGGNGLILGDDGNGGTAVMLRYTAAGVSTDQIVYTVMTLDLPGTLQRDTDGAGAWTGLNRFSTFTQADIDAGRVRFVHDGGEDFKGSFGFEVSAGLVDPVTLEDQTATGTFTIYATPVNDDPTISGSGNNTLKEGASLAITSSMLAAADPDDANSAESYLENPADGNYQGDNFALNHGTGGGNVLRLRITDLPDNGSLQVDTTGSGNWVAITQGEVDAQNGNALIAASWITGNSGTTRLRYVHSGSETTTDSFQAVAVDRRDATSGTGTVAFRISSVNDAPEIAQTPSTADPTEVGRDENAIDDNTDADDTTVRNDPVTVIQGGKVNITSTFLQAYDPDSTTKQVQYRITQTTTLGYLARSNDGGATYSQLGLNSAFTTQDVLDGKIWYIHAGAEPTTNGVSPDDLFKFTLADGDKEQNNNEFHIHISPSNETPLITAPSGPIAITSVVAANNIITGVSVDDTDLSVLVSTADGETDFLRIVVRLTQTNGTAFTAGDYADVAIGIKAASGVTVDADKDGANDYLVMQGTRAQLNDALSELSVTFTTDRNAEYKVQLIADDRLRDGSGALVAGANGGAVNRPAATGGAGGTVPNTVFDYYSDTPSNTADNYAVASIAIRASLTNEPPSLDNVPASITVTEDSSDNAIAGISVSDSDALTANIQVTLTVSNGDGQVTIGATSGVTGTGTGATLTLTGSRTAINTALNTLKFTPTADYNNQNDSQASITLEVSDLGSTGSGGAQTDTEVIAVKVDRVNDTPTVGGNPGTQVIDTGTTLTFSAGNGNLIQIDDPQDVATTVTDRAFTTGQMTVTVAVTMGSVALTTGGGAGISNNGTATVTVTGTIAQVNAALDGMVYTAPSADPDATATMTVTVDDGGNGGAGALQASLNFDIQMSTTNDPPVNTLPSSFSLAEDSSWTLVKDGSNQFIQIADSDNFGSSAYAVKLTAIGGQMRLQGSSNVTLSFGQGNANNSTDLTITGTLANINTALQLLKFRPIGDLHGPSGVASIKIVTTDDHPGGLAAQSDTDILAITVTPLNDDPSASGAYTVPAASEDGTGGGVVLATLLAAAYADATDDQDGFSNSDTAISGDDGATALSFVAIVGSSSYVAGQGTWQVQDGAGTGWIDIPVSGLSTTAALIFAADRQIRFVPAADFHGTPGTLDVRLADSSNLGAITASTASGDTRNLNSTGGLGTTGAWSPSGATIQTSVGNINDAPTLTASAATDGVEDVTPIGQTVSAIVAAQFSDATDNRTGITGGADASTSLGGIAVVGNAATTEGVWQYSADGNSWTDIGEGAGAPSDANAILLPTGARLRFVPAADFNGTPGALTIRASDSTVATIQTAQTVSYTATGQWSLTSTIGVTVAARNDAPAISGTATNPVVDENTGLGTGTTGLALITGAAATDAADFLYLGDDTFGGGTITVSITDGYVSGDTLSLNGSPAGIAATSGGSGAALVITLSSSATATQVASIIEAIRYNSTSDNPSVYGTDTDRAYSIVLSDGNNDSGSETAGGPAALSSNALTGTITFTVLNDAPVVDLNGGGAGSDNSVTFVEGANAAGTPVKIAASGGLSDVDNQNLTQMVLTVGAAPDGTAEVLNIGGSDFVLTGTTYTAVDVGSFLVSYDPGTLTFTITPDGSTIATVGAFETLLQGITYLNNSDTPNTTARTIDVQVTDAGLDDSAGGQADNQLASNTPRVTIGITPKNDQPRITGADPVTFQENALNAAAATLDSDFTITEPDSGDFNGGSLVVGGLDAADTVSLPESATAPAAPSDGDVWRDTDDNKVYVRDGGAWIEVGTASGGAGTNFTVSFTSTDATPARVEKVLEALTFANSAHTPTVNRTLTLTLDDGDGDGTTQAATLAVTITRQNDPASVNANNVTVDEGSSTVTLNGSNAAITVSDLDSPGTFSATVTVSKGVIIAVGGSGGAVSGTNTATVTISGVTQAELNARLQALTVQLIDEAGDPTRADWNGSFTVTVAVNDGGSSQARESVATILGDTDSATANPGDFAYANGSDPNIVTTRTFTVTVNPVNDAPVATATTTVTLTAMNEDSADADLPTSTVGSIASARFSDPLDPITDGSSADSFHGIAIVGNSVDNAKGDWEYQVDGTGAWTAVGNRSIANALVLDANDVLRFNPAADYFGAAPSLTVRIVEDGTDAGDAGLPTGGTTHDLTGATGGTTRYSANGFAVTTTVNAVNDAPTVDLNGGDAGVDNSVTFTEGANAAGTPVKIAAGGALADIDNTNLIRMTVTVGGVQDGNAEILTIGGTDFQLDTDASNVDVGAFTVSYAKATSIFTILPDGAAAAAVADFQTLLQGIAYSNGSDTPSTGNRTVDVAVTDAGIDNAGSGGGNDELTSNLPRTTIGITPANDQPRITGLDPVTFLENALNRAAAVLDGAIAIADADSADFNGGALVVDGLDAADTVSLPEGADFPGAPSDGDVWRDTDDNKVYVRDSGSWVEVGTASGGAGAAFTISFTTADATRARVERVIENLTFRNSDHTPTVSRTLTLTLSDGDTGGSTQAADLAVTITRQNDPASVTASNVNVDEGSATVVLNAGNANFTVGDLDAPGTFSATITVSTGTITAIGGAGGTVGALGGSSVTVTGATQAELNSRLQAITVTLPDEPAHAAGDPARSDWNGSFTVTVAVDDGGSAQARESGSSIDGDTGVATANPGDFAYADGANPNIVTTRTITVVVAQVNDAPVATATTTVTATSVAEDTVDASLPDYTVASLASGRFADPIDQITGGTTGDSFHGIAIVDHGVDVAKGVWEYQIDGAGGWTAVGNRAIGNALILDGNDKLRFNPAADYFGAATALSVRLVEDGTDPAVSAVPTGGSTVDLTGATGGATRYSANGFDITTTVTAVNDAPTVDLNGAAGGTGNAVTFTEGANAAHTPVKIAASGDLADIDNTSLVSMTLTIGGIVDGNAEVLNIGGTDFQLATDATNVDVGDFRVSYASGTGIFTVTPDGATVAALTAFETLLQGVTYSNGSDNPTSGDRTVDVKVRDAGIDNAGSGGVNGELDSNLPRSIITATAANDQPRLTLDAATFLENVLNQGAQFLDTSITLTDADSADFNGGSLVVSGLVAGQDIVSLPESATAPAAPADGDVWRDTDDNRVYVRDSGSWVEVGTATGGTGADLTISFTSTDATKARVQVVVEHLTFRNTSDTPTANRTLTLTLSDGDAGGTPVAADLPVAITPENDPTSITATAVTGAEGSATVVLDASNAAFSVSDPDVGSGTFDATVTLSAGTITAVGGAGGTLGALGGTSVTITGATQAELISRLRALTVTLPDEAGTPERTDWNGQFTVTVVTDDNGNSGQRPTGLLGDTGDATANPGDFAYVDGASADLQTTRTITVTVSAENDAPTTSSTATVTLTAIAEDIASAVNTGVTVASFAAGRFGDARDQITGGSVANSFHGIAIAGHTADAAKGSWQYQLDGTTTWTDIGDRSLATALVLTSSDRIRFAPAADYVGSAPNLTVRLVEDGGTGVPAAAGTVDLSAGGATGGTSRYSATGFDVAITVNAANDPPVVDLNGAGAGTGNAVTWTETLGAGANLPVKIAGSGTLADVDNTNLVQMVLTLGGVQDGNDEVLTIGGTAFALGTDTTNTDIGDYLVTVNATAGTITITTDGTAFDAVTDVQALLQGITYNNASSDPTAGNRTVQVQVKDAGNDDAAGTNQLDSNQAVATITVVPVNDTPSLTNVDAASFLENSLNQGWSLLDTSVDLSDLDSTHFNGGNLTVSGLVAGQDRVDLTERTSQPSTPTDGEVWRNPAGTVFIYDQATTAWLQIGTATGGNGTDFKVTFTSAEATVARVERVIESLLFRNSSDTPTANRTLSITVDDGGSGGTSTAATLPVTIVPENDPAAVHASDLVVTEGGATITLDGAQAGLLVIDPDVGAGLMQAQITVTNANFTAVGGAGGTITGLGSSTVTVTGASQAELITRLQSLTITLSDSPGLAAASDWNGSLTITVVVNDLGNAGQRPGSLIGDTNAAGANPGDYAYADGSSANLVTTRTIGVVIAAVNDAPVATDSNAVTLPGVASTVTDGANAGMSVHAIAAGKFSDPRDAIPGGSSSNGFHGIAIVDNVPDASRGSWQYRVDGGGPWLDVGTRSAGNALVLDGNDRLRFKPAAGFGGAAPTLSAILVEDGGTPPVGGSTVDLGAGAATGGTSRYADKVSAFQIGTTVTAVNTAPTADANGAAAGTDRVIDLVQTTGGTNVLANVPLFLGAPLADSDNQNLMSVTITVSGLADGGSERMVINGQELSLSQGQSTVSGAVSVTLAPGAGGTATLVLTRAGGGVLSLADANAVLQGMSYRNAAGSPGTDAARSFQVSTVDAGIGDAGGSNQLASNTATVTVRVSSSNLPPVAVLDTATTDESTPVSGNVLPNDSDPEGAPLTVQPRTVGGSNGGGFAIAADGSYTFTPGADFTDLDAGESRVTEATYTIVDASGQTATAVIRITVNGLSTAVPAPPLPTPAPTADPLPLPDPVAGPVTAPVPGPVAAPVPGPVPGPTAAPTGGPGPAGPGAAPAPAGPAPILSPPVVDIPFGSRPFADPSGGGGFGGSGAFAGAGQAGPGPGNFTFGSFRPAALGNIATAAGGNFGRTADPRDNPVRLTVALDAQVVGDTGAQTFSLPNNAFQHSDPSVQIRVEVTLADGSPLPKYIQFNPQTLSFTINPDLITNADPRKLDIKVVGRDPDGNEASTTFTLTIGGEADDEVIRSAADGEPVLEEGGPQDGEPAEGEGAPDQGVAPGEPDPGEQGVGEQGAAEPDVPANQPLPSDQEAAVPGMPILGDLAALDAWDGSFVPADDAGQVGEAGPSGRVELQRQSLRFAFVQERQSLLDDIGSLFS